MTSTTGRTAHDRTPMSGLDRRLLRTVPAARRFVLHTAAIGVATAVLVVVQAGLLAEVVSRAFLHGAGLAELRLPLVLLAVVVVGRAALGWAGEVSAHRASAAVTGQLRARLLEHVLRLGPRRRDLPGTGQLATLATTGVDGLDGYVSRYLPQLLVGAAVPLVVAVRILTVDWLSALLIGLTLPLMPLFMVLIGLHTRDRVARQWQALAVLGHHFLDVVAGLDVLTAYGRARRQGRQIATMSRRYRVETLRSLRVALLSALALELLATLSVALVAVAVGLRLVSGRLDLATGLLVIILAPEVFLPLRNAAARFHDSASGAAAADEVFAVLELPHAAGSAPPDPGPIRLEQVDVDGRAGPVLDGLSLTLTPGEVLGLTGPSGAGKSTVLDLLLGWRQPDRGRILVGDRDLSTVDRTAWMSRIAWVPQHPHLVAGTVADNLRLADPTAGPDRVAAVAAAVALDLPLDTPVLEGGGLSTGQQRRVAVGRALLADRPLLLLDEPTEGVDADTEEALLRALPAGRTAVIVSHRPAVLAHCDRVVRLPGNLPPAAPAETPPPAVVTHPAAPGRVEPLPAGTRRALAPLRPHRGRLALGVLAGAAAFGSAVALTATSAWLISEAALHPPVLQLLVAIVAVRAFGLAKGVFRYLERLVSHDVALRVLADLRVRLWDALVRLGPAVTGRLRRGELLARLVDDVEAQQDVVVRVVVPAAAAALVGIGTATALGILLPTAGLTLAAALLCAGVLAPALTVRFAGRATRRTAAARGAATAAVVELLSCAPDLVAFGAAERRRQAATALDAELTALRRRAAVATGAGVALTTLAIGAATVVCTALGVAALRAGAVPGTALAVLALTPLATAELVAALPEAARRLAIALPAARRLTVTNAPTAVAEPTWPLPVPAGHDLAAQRLSVRWPGALRDAVTGVDLDLPAGTRLILTGPSGCGKTTALAALMRTLDPSAGAVLLDDLDTRRLLGDDLRTRIGWCGPATHLFDSTLRENLRLARPGADDALLTDALRRAGLADWFAALPEGLATLVGRRGGGVSGGERQRIGLARVLLADRPVLLLDEPTAHLDADTAARVCADLMRATAGRTALVVSHRPDELPGLPQLQLAAIPAASRPAAR